MSMRISCLAALAVTTLFACSDKSDALSSTNNPVPGSISKSALATNVAVTYTDESAFVNSLSSYGYKTPEQLSLNRVGTTSGYTSVYGFNIPADRQAGGFKWNSGDEQTKEWRPQGITGFTRAGRRFVLVTWYGVDPGTISGINNQHKGVRVSLVDITNMSDIKYRHILLVQEKANQSNSELWSASNSYTQLGTFIPVTIHAGGIACYGTKVYVASTSLGIRVFDLTKMVSAAGDEGETRCGSESDGTLKAFNYAYVLPQIGYYKITNAKPFSCIETGTGTAGASDPMLWTGQYITSSETQVPKVYGFHLNTSGQIVNTPEVIQPIDDDGTLVHGIQGAPRGQ